MRKFITLIAMIVLAAGLHAQKDVTKFLGIPVDGTKSEMIQKLKAKGFTYDQKEDLLEREFNGEKVFIAVQTNNNKVWRIAVLDKRFRDETKIRIRFNNLLSQFENNSKYASYESNAMLEDDEDISYGITVEKKQYEAAFYQNMDSTIFTQYIKKQYAHEIKKVEDYIKQFTEEEWENPTQEMTDSISVLQTEFEGILFKEALEQLEKRTVWFTINDFYGEYYITMYYDNLYNRANGEDL